MKKFLAFLLATILISGAALAQPVTTKPSLVDMLTANCASPRIVIGSSTQPTCSNVALTNPASLATLTLGSAKTITISNTLTITATDGATLAIGAGGTLGTAAYVNTGTSGGVIPLLNAANTWALAQTFTTAPVFTDQSGSRTALGLGTAAVQNTGTSGANIPFLNGTNTWASAQTLTTAPVFTDQSGSRTALGLGSISTQAASSVALTGGTIAGLTGLAIRDTSAAFDVTIAATSSGALSAGRTLTLNVGNVAHTLALGTTANTITFPNLASFTVITNGDTGTVTNAMLANSSVTVNGTAISLGASGTVTAAAGTLTGATLNATVTASSLTSLGTITTLSSGVHTITSSSASALTVGLNGATNPAFQVDASTASQAAGLKLTGAATGGTIALAAIDSGSNTSLTINAKGTGTIGMGSVSTGTVTIAGGTAGTGTKLSTAGRGLFTAGAADPADGTPAGVAVGYNTGSDYGFIDAIQSGVAAKTLRLNTTGGAIQLNGQPTLTVVGSDTATADNTMCITSGGLVLKGTGTLGICLGTSGAQFKTAFAPMAAGIDDLMKVNFQNYRYLKGFGDDGAKLQYGATAQDVGLALPDLVRRDAIGNPINYDSGALLFIGLRAIQQLKVENNNLETRLTKLENRK